MLLVNLAGIGSHASYLSRRTTSIPVLEGDSQVPGELSEEAKPGRAGGVGSAAATCNHSLSSPSHERHGRATRTHPARVGKLEIEGHHRGHGHVEPDRPDPPSPDTRTRPGPLDRAGGLPFALRLEEE